jgi:outer membrane receptor protein involved in Fe transport
VYLQDEWKIMPQLTLNAGARFDVYTSDTDAENQISPRANLVYKPWESTTLHGGYSRYFTPPPLETVPAGNIAQFAGTSARGAVTAPTTRSGPNGPIIMTSASARRCRRARFDAGGGRLLQDGTAAIGRWFLRSIAHPFLVQL